MVWEGGWTGIVPVTGNARWVWSMDHWRGVQSLGKGGAEGLSEHGLVCYEYREEALKGCKRQREE